jgi:hypothetical protein
MQGRGKEGTYNLIKNILLKSDNFGNKIKKGDYYMNGINNWWQSQLTSNVATVTSLEEAIMRTTNRNSDMVYFHQDKNVFYRVKVDMEGRKSWASFNYSIPDPNTETPATKADIAELMRRIERLENSTSQEVTNNVKFDGQYSISNNGSEHS